MRSIVAMMVVVLGVVGLMGVMGAAVTLADTGTPDLCSFAEGVRASYDAASQELALVDLQTGDVVQMTERDLGPTEVIGWSPDCRYLVGVVGPFNRAEVPAEAQNSALGGYMALMNDVVVWDVLHGSRAATFEVPYRRHATPQVNWEASADGLFVLSSGEQFDWPLSGDDLQLVAR